MTRFLHCVIFTLLATGSATAQSETIRVDLKLRTGGGLSGLVVEHNDHGLVVVNDQTPYVFAWSELEAGSAYATRRALLALERGGAKQFSADDHYFLGVFALGQGRRDLAGIQFRKAKRLDSKYVPIVKKTFADLTLRDRSNPPDAPIDDGPQPSEAHPTSGELSGDVDSDTYSVDLPILTPLPAGDRRAEVLKAYKTFGEKVREVLGKDIVLVETDHFLIWTDWEAKYRDRLGRWCESMYSSLAQQFGIPLDQDVFLAKCPLFCWGKKARFRKFAQQFDGHEGEQAVGYTRSIEANGHVHVVLLRQGKSEQDFDRFACTLVHEGTHAFLHRLYSSRLIPHWVNEGVAELMAERVLGDRCPSGENASLLSQPFARFSWPIKNLIESSGPIEVHQYALAHSVIAYLASLDGGGLTALIRSLKAGRESGDALADSFDGMTFDDLEVGWRKWVTASMVEADEKVRATRGSP